MLIFILKIVLKLHAVNKGDLYKLQNQPITRGWFVIFTSNILIELWLNFIIEYMRNVELSHILPS